MSIIGKALRIDRMSVAKKLVFSFSFLILLVSAAGLTGWFFIEKVHQKIRVFSDLTSPMVKTTGAIGQTMLMAHLEALEGLSFDDEQSISDRGGAIRRLEKEFSGGLIELRSIAAKGDLDIDVGGLAQAEKTFFAQAGEMITANHVKRQREMLPSRNSKIRERKLKPC